jgi:hypothetical protein
MRHSPGGKYLAEPLRRSSKDAADSHIKCTQCAGLIDISTSAPPSIMLGDAASLLISRNSTAS